MYKANTLILNYYETARGILFQERAQYEVKLYTSQWWKCFKEEINFTWEGVYRIPGTVWEMETDRNNYELQILISLSKG